MGKKKKQGEHMKGICFKFSCWLPEIQNSLDYNGFVLADFHSRMS